MKQLFSEPVSYYNHFASDVRLSIRPSVHPSIRPSVHPSIRLSTIMCARQFLRNYLVDFNDTWYNTCMIGGVDARSLIFEIGPFSATRSRVKRSEIHFLLTITCARQFLGNYMVDFNDTWYNTCMIGGVDARSLIFEIGPFSATRSRVKRSEIHFLLNISLKCQIGTYIVLQTFRKSLVAFHFTL